MMIHDALFRSLCIASSSLFLCGSCLLIGLYVIYAATEFPAGDDARAAAVTLEIVGLSLIGGSTLPEMIIDAVIVTRPSLHGRYGQLHPAMNWFQTVTFVGGVVLEGLAKKRAWDDGYETNDYLIEGQQLALYAAILFSLSGASAVLSVGCCCCGSSRGKNNILQTANGLFFGATIAMIIASLDNKPGGGFLNFFITFGVRVILCLVGILWMVVDAAIKKKLDVATEGSSYDAGELVTHDAPEEH